MRMPAAAGGAVATAVSKAVLTQHPIAAAAGLFTLMVGVVYVLLQIPSRSYKDGEGTVGKEYDAWTEEGLLEYYWVMAACLLRFLPWTHERVIISYSPFLEPYEACFF